MADGTDVARQAVFVGPRLVPKDALLNALGCDRDDTGQVRVDRVGPHERAVGVGGGQLRGPGAQLISAAGDASRAAMAINNELVAEGTYTER